MSEKKLREKWNFLINELENDKSINSTEYLQFLEEMLLEIQSRIDATRSWQRLG